MIELRWLDRGAGVGVQLQYSTKLIENRPSGSILLASQWSEWTAVPTIYEGDVSDKATEE